MTRTNDRTKLFVIFGLGANLSDPLGKLQRATELLARRVMIEKVSSVYVTEPVGFADQPDFYNLVLSGTTGSTIYELHTHAQEVEAQLGREARSILNGPRAIDIDLLAFGELVLTSPRLTVPHPRMLDRSFVLEPLLEIEPEWQHPVRGWTAEQGLAALESPSRVELYGSLPQSRGGGGEDE